MDKDMEIKVSVAEVVDYLRLKGIFASALREVVRRKVTKNAAIDSGITISTEELQQAADEFRAAKGLRQASDTENWLKSAGVSLEVLEEFLETKLLISKFKDELEKKTDKESYLSGESTRDFIRDSIYKDWIKEAFK